MDFTTRPTGALAKIADALPHAESIRVENAFPWPEGGWELVVTLVDEDDSVEPVLDELADVTVLDLDRMVPSSDVFHLFLLTVDDGPFVLETLLETESIPDHIRLSDGQLSVRATVRDWTHLKELGREIEETYGRFELVGVTETDHPGFPLGGADLTRIIEERMNDDQLELLELAFERGFFDLPRRVTEADLAAELDLSQSTVSERLRMAQRSLLAIVFGQR